MIATLTILILSTALIQQVTPVLSKFIVDDIYAKLTGTGGDIDRLYFLIGLSFVMTIMSTILKSLSDRMGDHFAGRIRKYLTVIFYEKILTLPQSYFDSEISGKIVNQLNRGITTIQGFMNTGTNFIFPTFLQSILTIGILARINVPIAFFTFILFPVYLFLSYLSTKEWGKLEVKKNELEDKGRGRIYEVINNIKLVKSFNNEAHELNYLSDNLENINQIYKKQSSTFHIYDFLRNNSLNLILLIINILVFISAFNGALTFGDMVLVIQLVGQAQRPLFAMSFILTQIQMAESGSKEYLGILNLESKEFFNSDEKVSKIDNPEIEFKNVSFSYEGSENAVLKDISFKLSKNEKIALVGPSGAGKSTIINLILKFYNPTSGEILLNGKKYSELSHKSIRENTTLVFQDNELFSSTIRENVAYASNASDEEIIEALKKANAYEFVNKMAKGIDTEIGERGIKLSGGQKQRIQIARAILKNTPILILDEATSNLDSESETKVQEAMERLVENKLVIIIAHRFSTIQNVQRIFVVNDGKIEDSGEPKDLANRPGIYSTLLRYQIEGDKKLLKNYDMVI